MENIISHYSCELPGVESNLERASEVAFDEVTLEIPQQQAPNAQMASTTLPDISVPEQVASDHFVHKQTVPEQTLSVHIECNAPFLFYYFWLVFEVFLFYIYLYI